jgi:hypothetical protein
MAASAERLQQGNRYIRKMLVTGSTSVLRVAGKRKGALVLPYSRNLSWTSESQKIRDKIKEQMARPKRFELLTPRFVV